MKGAALAFTVVVALLVAGGTALYAYSKSEYTACYAIFKTKEAAEQAAETGRRQGLDPAVDHRAVETVVTFETGETGNDARQARRRFRAIVERERGILGHPGGGCLERGPID